MKAYRASRGMAPLILKARCWSLLISYHSGSCTQRNEPVITLWIRGWVDPRTDLEKSFAPAGYRTPSCLARSLVNIVTALSQFPGLHWTHKK